MLVHRLLRLYCFRKPVFWRVFILLLIFHVSWTKLSRTTVPLIVRCLLLWKHWTIGGITCMVESSLLKLTTSPSHSFSRNPTLATDNWDGLKGWWNLCLDVRSSIHRVRRTSYLTGWVEDQTILAPWGSFWWVSALNLTYFNSLASVRRLIAPSPHSGSLPAVGMLIGLSLGIVRGWNFCCLRASW